jgi:cytochrome b pre-mRNA-processing protein 3
MFSRLFGGGRRQNQEVTDALYEQIVAAARQPVFYSDWGVPDTPLGRYEMLSLHMILFLERARGASKPLADIAQEITDEFFQDIDHSLRELGIGDTSVPKRMKRLARMFYGRAESYQKALLSGDAAELSAAVARNVRPEEAAWPQADHLARHLLATHGALAAQDEEALLSGTIRFPAPAPVTEPQS